MSLIHPRRPRGVRARTCTYGPAGSGSPTPDPAPDALRPGRSVAPSAPPAPPAVLRARRGLLGLYLLLGMTMSSWLARLPTVRAELGLSTGELGTILLLGAVGSLVTLLGAGAVAVRWGSVNTLVAAAAVFSVANLLLGLGPAVGSVVVLTVGVVLLSTSFALGNVPMNLETVAIERAMKRTIVPQFHAAFSVGSVLGSGVGAAAAWGQVPLIVQFGVISVVSLVWRLRAIPRSVLAVAEPRPTVQADRATGSGRAPAGPAPVSRRTALRNALGAWRERRTIVIGVVVMAAALSEGSANNWLAIGVVDGFARTEAVAALVFGVFVASMTVARLVGTAVLDRYGRVAVLSASGLIGLVGVAVFGLGPNLPLAVIGVVCWGLGTGLIVPIGIAAVSADPMKAAGRVAVVSAFASGASLAAPPLIGVVAEHVGVRNALLFVCVGMVAATFLAREAGAGHQPSVPAPTADPRADEARTDETRTTSGTDAVRPSAPAAVPAGPVRTEPVPTAPVSTGSVPVVARARHREHGWSRAHAVRRTARALVGQTRR